MEKSKKWQSSFNFVAKPLILLDRKKYSIDTGDFESISITNFGRTNLILIFEKYSTIFELEI